MKPKILEYRFEALLRFDPADAAPMHEILEQCRKHGVVKIKSVRLRKVNPEAHSLTVNELPGHHMNFPRPIGGLTVEGAIKSIRETPLIKVHEQQEGENRCSLTFS